MNRKGFTLIELIATIALLAIIATIAFVSINKVIEQNKINNCHTLVDNIVTATNEYVSDNRYNTTFVNGITNYRTTIYADTLVNNNYLGSPIINPYTNDEIIPSDIEINVSLNDDYTMYAAVVNSPDMLKECDVRYASGLPEPKHSTPVVDDDNDLTPPIITYSLAGGTYTGAQSVTVSASDTNSGVNYLAVDVYKDGVKVSGKSTGNAPNARYTVNMDTSGTWQILSRAYDNAGNKSNQTPMNSDGWYYQTYVVNVNKPIHVYYNANGGSISGKCAVGTGTSATCTSNNGWASVNGTLAYQIINPGTSADFWNYNNTSYLNIKRDLYIANTNQEWNTNSAGSGTTFSHSTAYSYDQLKAYTTDKGSYHELDLYVKWVKDTPIITSETNGACYKYNRNDGFEIVAQISSGGATYWQYSYDSDSTWITECVVGQTPGGSAIGCDSYSFTTEFIQQRKENAHIRACNSQECSNVASTYVWITTNCSGSGSATSSGDCSFNRVYEDDVTGKDVTTACRGTKKTYPCTTSSSKGYEWCEKATCTAGGKTYSTNAYHMIRSWTC